MQEIADWLEKLGMSEYAERFAENRIDLSVLPDLTDQDLEKLGVVLGDRRKILRAIANLDNASPAAAPASAPSSVHPIAVTIAGPASEVAGERRHVTVMFCDLVDSTGIASRLDAEEWRDLVGAYLEAASAAVMEMGGKVAKKLGDGLMAQFGYPVAQENDAERAVRAALAIQRALAELNRRNEGTGMPVLAARIAIDSGPVVIDALGEIFGDVPNIAARAQALAEPGSVVVTARVHRQVAGLFVAEECGSHELKGVPEPVTLYRIVRVSGGGRRAGQRHLTPLVGREEELAILMRRWERARAGDGQMVLIVGEPGLGKSRLIEEFHRRLAETPHTWVEWSCSQLLQNTPLHPIAEWGRQRFGGVEVPAERRLADLESSLSQVKLDPAENVPLLGPLLDIPLPPDRAPVLAPEELRRRQLATLTNWVIAGARGQPVVLVLEDLHWSDPTTLDLLRGIAERGALSPLLVLITARPEFRPPWSTRSHHSTISLSPLDRHQVQLMVGELAARHALSKEVVEGVTERTGGIPLFVEEVTRLLLERGEEGGIHAIPPTLHQSLTARLDRLGSAREVAQVGAVIGRGFSYGLLRAVAEMDDAPLQAALEKLADADIVLIRGLPPDSDYRFKHALIQDAAYENLLKSRRQVLHRRVAETLRERFADAAAAEPEVLAHHFTQAGFTDAAIEWWGKAGDQALRRSAFQEAIAHLGKAIEMADKEGDAKPRAAASASAGRRLKLQTTYGNALIAARGHGASETVAAFARARELAEGIADPVEQLSVLYGQWVGSFIRCEIPLAREVSAAALQIAERYPETAVAAVAYRLHGLIYWFEGDFATARQFLERSLALFVPDRDRDLAFRFGQDIGVAFMNYLAFAIWPLGQTARAQQLQLDAVARARQTEHVPTLAYEASYRAVFEMMRLDPAAAAPFARETVQLAKAHELQMYRGYGEALNGWARAAHLGELAEGIAEMRQGIEDLRQIGINLLTPLFHARLAALEVVSGECEKALARVDQAIADSARRENRTFDAELHRIRGEISLKCDPANTARAEEAFLTAIGIAQQQRARSFELRAALSLARLYQSAGRAAGAHAVLAPALAGFSPTPELPEIAEGQALLATLEETDEVKNAGASRQLRLGLQNAYAQALIYAKGYTAPETSAALARASELAAGSENRTERLSVHFGLWINQWMRGELAAATASAASLLREAEANQDLAAKIVGQRMSGACQLFAGNFAVAREHFEELVRLYDPSQHRELAVRFGVFIGAYAVALWALGEIQGAAAIDVKARVQAEAGTPAPALANFYTSSLLGAALRRDYDVILANSDAMAEFIKQSEMRQYAGFSAFFQGVALQLRGEQGEGVAEMVRAAEQLKAQGVLNFRSFFTALIADAQAEEGEIEAALASVSEALISAVQTGERWFEAEAQRIRGEILLKQKPVNKAAAEEAFRTALVIAQKQKAKSFELRAAMSMARLWRDQGKRDEARDLLAPVYGWFTEGFDTRDLKEAKKLLDELSA